MQEMFSVEKRVFICSSFAKCVPWKKSPKFSKKHPASTVLFIRTNFRTMWKLWNKRFNTAQNESMRKLCSTKCISQTQYNVTKQYYIILVGLHVSTLPESSSSGPKDTDPYSEWTMYCGIPNAHNIQNE
jgi:hypothetical protein